MNLLLFTNWKFSRHLHQEQKISDIHFKFKDINRKEQWSCNLLPFFFAIFFINSKSGTGTVYRSKRSVGTFYVSRWYFCIYQTTTRWHFLTYTTGTWGSHHRRNSDQPVSARLLEFLLSRCRGEGRCCEILVLVYGQHLLSWCLAVFQIFDFSVARTCALPTGQCPVDGPEM